MEEKALTTIDEKQIGHVTEQFNWVGLNPAQIKGVAQAMALSGMFQDIGKDSAKAFVKIMAGQEMGIAPFQAMSDISIIQGKAAAGGNIYASKVKSSGKYDYRVKRWDNEVCEIEFSQYYSGKRESLGTVSFSMEDAKTAGLAGKGNWNTYPRNMLFNRAMTNGVRTLCPDALNGVNAYTPEELGATVDGEGHIIDGQDAVPEPPKPKTATKGSDTKEAETVPPNVLQEISDELESKGFDTKEVRAAIALRVGDVENFVAKNQREWRVVLEQIKKMDTEELATFLEPGDDIPDDSEGDAVPVSDEDLTPEAIQSSLDDVNVGEPKPVKAKKK